MAIFKPKVKQVEFETEDCFQGFTVDTNGFIIFDDSDLGGVGIFEVTPLVTTAGYTRTDNLSSETDMDAKDYISEIGEYFDNTRRDIILNWVFFLNKLHAENDSEDPIHVQIVVKKMRSWDWDASIDNGIYYTQHEFEALANDKRTAGGQWMDLRRKDYFSYLLALQDDIYENSTRFDFRQFPVYKTRMFMIVSYTPSSEGWWIDGRDSDYYVQDVSSPTSLFQDDKAAEKIADKLVNRVFKKQNEEEYNTAFDLFFIESDKTAQIINTRMRKIEQVMDDVGEHATFSIRRLSQMETSTLVAFYNDLLTPYVEKAQRLKADFNDIYHNIDNQMAFATGSFTDYAKLNSDDIIYGNVDLMMPEEKEAEFLARFKDRDRDSIMTIGEEMRKKAEWDAEKYLEEIEEDYDPFENARNEFWQSINPDFVVATPNRSDAQLEEEEFLNRFKNRSLTVAHKHENAQAKNEGNFFEEEEHAFYETPSAYVPAIEESFSSEGVPEDNKLVDDFAVDSNDNGSQFDFNEPPVFDFNPTPVYEVPGPSVPTVGKGGFDFNIDASLEEGLFDKKNDIDAQPSVTVNSFDFGINDSLDLSTEEKNTETNFDFSVDDSQNKTADENIYAAASSPVEEKTISPQNTVKSEMPVEPEIVSSAFDFNIEEKQQNSNAVLDEVSMPAPSTEQLVFENEKPVIEQQIQVPVTEHIVQDNVSAPHNDEITIPKKKKVKPNIENDEITISKKKKAKKKQEPDVKEKHEQQSKENKKASKHNVNDGGEKSSEAEKKREQQMARARRRRK